MPYYDFRNTTTGEEFQESMSIAAMEAYLTENPHIKFHVKSMVLGDAVKLHITKPPSDFQKYVLGRIKERNPLGCVEHKFGSIAREW